MADVPLLGFFLAAIVTFIYGSDENNNFLLVLSSLFISLAILTKYSGLLLIPILCAYDLLNKKKKGIIFLLIPTVIFILWNGYCVLSYRQSLFLAGVASKLQQYIFNRIWIRVFASLSSLSGVSLVVLFIMPLLLLKKKGLFCFFISIVSGVLPFMVKDIFGVYSLPQKYFLAVLFVASTYAILFIFKQGIVSLSKRSDGDTAFLFIWFLSIFMFNLLANFIAARFTLLLLPPLFFFIYNQLAPYNAAETRSKLTFVILIPFVFSTVLAMGDYQAAGVYRHFVGYIKQELPVEENNYFFCGEYYRSWGYFYYLQKAYGNVKRHFQMINETLSPEAVIVVPAELVLPIVIERWDAFSQYLDKFYNKNLINSISYKGNIFLHHKKFRAGFYSHDWGLLPFYISVKKEPLEKFEIYRLTKGGG
ncbi:MAG: hypothetical protein ABH858_00280, partial [Candidatus Omnitrophota bacterium]